MTNSIASDHWVETYKSLVTLSIEGFKFSALANGGAAVAILAYLGNIAGKAPNLPDMRVPMVAFLLGVLLCGLTLLFAYLTQLRLLNEISRSDRPTQLHHWFLWAAILSYALSLVAFGFGAWQSVIHFR